MEPGKGHFLSDIQQKRNQNDKTEWKLKQKLDISFLIFSRKEIKTIKQNRKKKKVSKKVNSLFYEGSPICFTNLPWGPQQNNIHTHTYNALFKTMIKMERYTR